MSRPELVEIGKNVFLHRGTIILTHDWASWCFVNSYGEFLPSHGKVKIGDNVWLGENVTILKGVTVGDNVIIGIGAIVTKDIPANSVAVGIPAKVVCTYEDYYKKRLNQYIDECIEYALAIKKLVEIFILMTSTTIILVLLMVATIKTIIILIVIFLVQPNLKFGKDII